jgi:hypothetical protein
MYLLQTAVSSRDGPNSLERSPKANSGVFNEKLTANNASSSLSRSLGVAVCFVRLVLPTLSRAQRLSQEDDPGEEHLWTGSLFCRLLLWDVVLSRHAAIYINPFYLLEISSARSSFLALERCPVDAARISRKSKRQPIAEICAI